jgi:2-(1,2-epoxy-1,2-dihydrophenyl)acetyl-CoA isomerase
LSGEKLPHGAALLERREGLAILTLDRPDAGNAMSQALAEDLVVATRRLATDRSLRALLLRGNGRAFSVGGGVDDFAAAGDALPGYLRELVSLLHGAVSQLHALEVPVVAAVRGVAAGGGLSLACSCDLVVAGESARFVVAYAGIGLSPDLGASATLPRLLGIRRALDFALSNRAMGAAEALAAGLVTRVVPDDEVEGEAEELATRLANGPTLAYAAIKRLMREGDPGSFEGQLRKEADSIVRLAASADAREGIAAFLAKRKPAFHGR